MKQCYLLLLAVLCLSGLVLNSTVQAQGIYQFWGATAYGGADDLGTLFSTRSDGTGHTVKRVFKADNPGRPSYGNSFTAFNNKFDGNASNYDKLLLKMLPEKFLEEKDDLYKRLLHICHYVSLLTDGNALELYDTINGKKTN